MTDRRQIEYQDMKLPPQSLEAEQSVLGAILNYPDTYDRAVEAGLKRNHFYREANGLIFEAAESLMAKDEPVDLITMSEELKSKGVLEKIGGPAVLAELADAVGTAANVSHYAGIVREKAMLRRVISISQNASEQAYEAGVESEVVIEGMENSLIDIMQDRALKRLERFTLAKITTHTTKIEERHNASKRVSGLPTGLLDLDALTFGWQKGELVILAGRPSLGKTALALNLAPAAKVPVAFFSLEQTESQLLNRMLSNYASIPGDSLRGTRHLTNGDWERLVGATADVSSFPIYWDDSPESTVLEIRSKVRNLNMRLAKDGESLGMVVIDYLQLIKGLSVRRRREEEVSAISASLKAMAKELNIPVMALSQLNRRVEERPNKRPVLADLRESGAIEQDADVVMFIYRAEVYATTEAKREELAGECELIIAKNRNGRTGTVKVIWQPDWGRFVDRVR